MAKKLLETLEREINAELKAIAKTEKSKHDPITDGVVDIDLYLASKPKVLWILKEPWEPLKEGDRGGRWSLTKHLIPDLIAKNEIGGVPTYRKMAYVTYSVLNNFRPYADIPYTTDDVRVRESLKTIAYINVSKYPGKTTSDPATIASYYNRNRAILKKQIDTIAPDVIVAGNILHLFYEDFGIAHQEMTSAGKVEYCFKNGRLYVNAYHPGYWRCKEETYVNDITAIIKKYYPKPQPSTAEIAFRNPQSAIRAS